MMKLKTLRKTEVKPGKRRRRKRETTSIAAPRHPVDQGAAGIGQSNHFGALVEGFARGVIERGADHFHAIGCLNQDELGVTTAHREVEEGKGRHGLV